MVGKQKRLVHWRISLGKFTLYNDDCLNVLKNMLDNSVDSCVTDPPYGLSFMGKSWDASGIAYNVDMWRECLRVLKPGGHMLAFSGSRTYHRMTCAIEDAGFEVRDQIMWVYGSGFPKSHNVSKAIDSHFGAERKVLETKVSKSGGMAHIMKTNSEQGYRPNDYYEDSGNVIEVTEAATAEAKQWEGWGTALKPAHEPICVARKPLEGTVAANVLKWGVGGLNIDASRIPLDANDPLQDGVKHDNKKLDTGDADTQWGFKAVDRKAGLGRWPANIIHDGSDEVTELFPQTGVSSGGKSGHTGAYQGGFKEEYYGDEKPGFGDSGSAARYFYSIRKEGGKGGIWGEGNGIPVGPLYNDDGSAARFFYCAKASNSDRNDGLDGFSEKKVGDGRKKDSDAPQQRGATMRKNTHPTVKPTDLMRYLCRMVTPPGGTVLDPFTGSGSTGRGAVLEGFNFIGIEMNPEYIDIARARIGASETVIQAKEKELATFNNLFEINDE